MKAKTEVPQLVIRVGRRKTSWESRDVETIVETEFKQRDGVVDTQPSVYALRVGSQEAFRSAVVRVVAEHSASFLNDPPKGSNNLDIAGLAATSQTPGESGFAFANDCHHEVQLDGVTGLRDLVRRALIDIEQRVHTVTRDELLGYAAEHLAAGDPEWEEALRDKREWQRLISRRNVQST